MNKSNSSFVYYKKYDNYKKDVGEISKDAIVFVEDRKSIWTHGVEYGGSGLTIELTRLNEWTFKDNSGSTLATISTATLTEDDVNRLIASGVTITIDSELSDTSTNAVQNKVIKAALDTKLNTESYVVDDVLSENSTNPVLNKVVKAAIDNIKIPSLTGYLKKSTAADTYATKDELNLKANASALEGKVDSSTLEDYATLIDLDDYATKTELASKADSSLLSNYATTASLSDYATNSNLAKKLNILTAGKGISITGNIISTTVDTSVFIVVDELPDPEEDIDSIDVNKIYIYNNMQYRYIPEPEVEEGEEIPEGDYGWVVIGQADADVDLSAYLKSSAVYYPSGTIPYTPEGQEGYEESLKLIDTTISTSSVNPIQNKAVAEALATKADSTTIASTYVTKQALADSQTTAGNTYATKTALNTGLAGKQDVLTAGDGISIQNGVISSTVDNDLYIIVDELPLIEIDPNKIYILETQNENGSYSYTEYRYRPQPVQDEDEEEENADMAYGWFPIGREFEGPDLSGLASKADLNLLRNLVELNNNAALKSTDLSTINAQIAALQEFADTAQTLFLSKDNSFALQADLESLISRLGNMYAPANDYATAKLLDAKITSLYSYLHKRLNWIQERIARQYVLKVDIDPATTRDWSTAETYEFDVNEATSGPSFVTMSKAKYDKLVELGQVSQNTYYFTYEGEDEPAGETWQFGGTFPITLTDNWTFGGTFPIRLK